MKQKIVVFSGAGVSAESGLQTFRDMGGYWYEYSIEEVATPEGWAADPAKVMAFYNERRKGVLAATPNAAHLAIAQLEEQFDVVVITQNIDDLHERAGSTRVLHVHGEILKARSSIDPSRVYPMTTPTLQIGDLCEDGSQLRPHVVWFGEDVHFMEQAADHFASADKILVVGTSLSVFPAAGLVTLAPRGAEKYLVAPEVKRVPTGYRFLEGTATAVVPPLAARWLEERRPA